MKNDFVCNFSVSSPVFRVLKKCFCGLKCFFLFNILFLSANVFAEDVYYRWTEYDSSWIGNWTAEHEASNSVMGYTIQSNYWSYWKSENTWEKSYNTVWQSPDTPGSSSKKNAYTYFTGESEVTATLDTSPANKLACLYIGDCYKYGDETESKIGSNLITIKPNGNTLKTNKLVMGNSDSSVGKVNFALSDGGSIKSSGSLTLYAGKKHNITIGDNTTLKVSSIEIAGSGETTLNISGSGKLEITSNVTLPAGLTANISVKYFYPNGTLTVKDGATVNFEGGEQVTVSGKFTNGGTVTFKDVAYPSFKDGMENNGTVTVSGSKEIQFDGKITNNNAFNFEQTSTVLVKSTFTNGSDGTVKASGTANTTFNESVTNSGTVELSDSAKTTFSKSFTNKSGASFTVATESTETTISGKFTNSGTAIIKEKSVFSVGGTTENKSSLTFADAANVTLKDFENSSDGTFTATGTTVTIVTGSFTNAGTFSANKTATLTVEGKTENTSSLTISASAKGMFKDAFTNSGTFTADGTTLTDNAQNVIFGGTFNNSGTAYFKNSTNTTVTGAAENSGSIELSGIALTVFSSTFTNKENSTVTASGSSSTTVKGKFTNSGTAIIKEKSVFSVDGTTENKSSLTFADAANVTLKDFENASGGTFTATDTTETTISGKFTNSGTTEIKESAVFTVEGKTENTSSLTISASAKGTFTGAFTNSGTFTADGTSLTDNAQNVTFGGMFTNNGTADFKGSVSSTFTGTVTNSSDKTMTFSESSVTVFKDDVTNSGTFTANGSSLTNDEKNITFEKNYTNESTGKTTFAGSVTTFVGENFTNNNSLIVSDSATATVDGTLTNSGTTEVSSSAKVTVKDIENSSGGTFTATGTTVTTISGKFTNSGTTEIKESATFTVEGESENTSSLTISSTAKGTFTGAFTNSGTFTADGTTLTDNAQNVTFGGTFTNNGTADFKGSVSSTFTGTVTNSSDKTMTFSESSVTVFKDDVTNSGTFTANGSSLTNDEKNITFEKNYTNESTGKTTFSGSVQAEFTNFLNAKDATLKLSSDENSKINFKDFSNEGTVYSNGIAGVTFGKEITDSGTWEYSWEYSGGAVLVQNIKYNIIIFKAALSVSDTLFAQEIIDDTEDTISLSEDTVFASPLVTLNKNSTFNVAGHAFTFGNGNTTCAIETAKNTQKNLTIADSSETGTNNGTGSVSFGTIGTNLAHIGDVLITPAATFKGDVYAKTLTAQKTAEISSTTILTKESQTYTGAVTVPASTLDFYVLNFNATEGSIQFLSTFLSSAEINMNATKGSVQFDSTFSNLGKTTINAVSLKASGKFSSSASVTVNASGTAEFGSETELSSGDLSVTAGETVTFTSKVTLKSGTLSVTSDKSATFAGLIDVSGGAFSVKSVGDATFASGVSVSTGNFTVESGSSVDFSSDSSVVKVSDGSFSVTANEGKTVHFACGVDVKKDVTVNALSVQFDSYFICDNATINAQTYFSAFSKESVQIKSSLITVEKDLFISAIKTSDTNARKVNLSSCVTVNGNFVLLNGNVVLSDTASLQKVKINAKKDIILLNGNVSSMYDDVISSSFSWRSGVKNIFKYRGTVSFPAKFPDGNAISTSEYKSSLSGLEGSELSTRYNFYDNGVSLESTSSWVLKAGNNDESQYFAEVYNATLSYCSYSSSTSSGISYLSCAEATDGGNNNENVCFAHPIIDKAYTVFDDVIYISFKDSVLNNEVKIENSNNEISKTIKENKTFFTTKGNSEQVYFVGTYTDSDCTESTDGKGDISSFYVKVSDENTWNTDATGTLSGDEQSTDMAGRHRSAIPYLKIVRAIDDSFSGLLSEHKNRIASYSGEDGNAIFTDVTDLCKPVLVAVRTGQELHKDTPSEQEPYDSHNFIEFQYSESVTVNGGDSEILNEQTSSLFGGITNLNSSIKEGIEIAGLIQTEGGKVSLGSKDSVAKEELNAYYRKFASSINDGAKEQTHRFRIALAGYRDSVQKPSGFYYWPGYINSDDTEIPSGAITVLENSSSYTKDLNGNTLFVKNLENHKLKSLSVISLQTDDSYETDWSKTPYGTWDLSAPVFAPYRSSSGEDSGYYEILGSCKSDGTYLDRVEFHVFDNAEEYFTNAKWYSQLGWGNTASATLYDTYTYPSDIFGGSRPFDWSSSLELGRATLGGLRYSTLYDKSSYFKYGLGSEEATTDFKSENISSGVKSSIYFAQNGSKREISENDSLYFTIFLKEDTNLPLTTTFLIKYDEDACVTDLAGNRMKSAEVSSVNRISPKITMTACSICNSLDKDGRAKLYVLFNKKLNMKDISLKLSDGTYTTKTLSDSLRFIKIPETPHVFQESDVVSDLQIDKTVQVKELFKDSKDFTGVIFTLNRAITLEDVKNLYIQCYSPDGGSYEDSLTGLKNIKVTCVQDSIGNFMTHGEAHAISDFAVNAVNPVYAYDDRFLDSDFGLSTDNIKDSNLSIHDWSKEQKNDGTLLTEHDFYVVTSQNTGVASSNSSESSTEEKIENIVMYFDKNPDSDSVSKEYNKNLSEDLRIWLPSIDKPSGSLVGAVSAISLKLNTSNLFVLPQKIDDSLATFLLNWDELNKNGYSAGNQISFLFGLLTSDGDSVKICHAPLYDEINEKYTLEMQPLFALRLKDSSDPSSLDLWSFRLKNLTSQRGNVTILNNVIDVNNNESAVIQVDLPCDGPLNVVVMTLDGNVIRYLQHGSASSGRHSYAWDGKTKSGKKTARGLYFVRVFGSGIDETRKIMVVKN